MTPGENVVRQRAVFAMWIRILGTLRLLIARRAQLQAEILLLRQQLIVLNRQSRRRLKLRNIDRVVLTSLSKVFPSLLDAIVTVKPDSVLCWHRAGFRAYWQWKSRRRGAGRHAPRAQALRGILRHHQNIIGWH